MQVWDSTTPHSGDSAYTQNTEQQVPRSPGTRFKTQRCGEKVKSEFSRLKKSFLRCALERHCLALRAEWRPGGLGGGWGVKFRAHNSPSWIRCSLSCRLRYITPTPSHKHTGKVLRWPTRRQAPPPVTDIQKQNNQNQAAVQSQTSS